MNGNTDDTPATRRELSEAVQMILDRLEATETRFAERLEATEIRFAERLEATEIRFAERLESTETKLLSAFFNYQDHARIDMRRLKADVSNIDAAAEQRFENIENRLIALEKIILSKPPERPSA